MLGVIKTDGESGVFVIVARCCLVGPEGAVARLDAGDRAHRVSGPDVGDVDERLVDEDDRDQDGEALLGEASDVANQRAEVESDGQQQHQRHPDADPQAER